MARVLKITAEHIVLSKSSGWYTQEKKIAYCIEEILREEFNDSWLRVAHFVLKERKERNIYSFRILGTNYRVKDSLVNCETPRDVFLLGWPRRIRAHEENFPLSKQKRILK